VTSDAVVVDTSVFVAGLLGEPEGPRLVAALRKARTRLMSAGNYLGCAIVAERKVDGRADLDAWLVRETVVVVPVDLDHARLAADAFARFGKGRHPASLNYGDCFAYALAKSLNAPLLYKGGDFARTDIASALA
jgi:ribonuclease VapC